jgi:hypothetical protein
MAAEYVMIVLQPQQPIKKKKKKKCIYQPSAFGQNSYPTVSEDIRNSIFRSMFFVTDGRRRRIGRRHNHGISTTVVSQLFTHDTQPRGRRTSCNLTGNQFEIIFNLKQMHCAICYSSPADVCMREDTLR